MPVNMEPSGIGEGILYGDAASLFAGWQRVRVTITPNLAYNAFGHLAASGFSRPGDGPVLFGLSSSGIAPGSQTALDIYDRAHNQASYQGAAWDADLNEVAAYSSPSSSAPPKGATAQELYDWSSSKIGLGDPTQVDYATPEAAAAAGMEFDVPEQDISLLGIIKGTSRWLMLALDTVPEGIDAVGRAVMEIKQGNLTVAEAAGGFFGIDREAAMSTGVPFFQYLRSAVEGERLNMGTGWFAQGEVAADVQMQLALYDQETHGDLVNDPSGHGFLGLVGRTDPQFRGGLTEADFDKARERGNGRVMVQGLHGMVYEARDLDEWKFLRDNVGRAALLADLRDSSLQQQQLGQAHGAFQEQIFDEGTVGRSLHGDKLFVIGTGKAYASLVSQPDTVPFNIMSGTIDFSKNLIDLPVAKAVTGTRTLLSGANRFVGLAEEAGDLAQGTATMNKVLGGADNAAVPLALNDMQRGAINVDMAAQAIARQSDEALTRANVTVADLRAAALKRARDEGLADMTPEKIDTLIDRAARAKTSGARIWAENTLEGLDETTTAAERVANLQSIYTRADDIDLLNGRYGPAVVDDEVFTAARAEVDHLNNLVTRGKASVIYDPSNGRSMLTFDADLGKAQETLRTLDTVVDETISSRTAAASRYLAARNAYEGAREEVFEELGTLRAEKAGNLYVDSSRLTKLADEMADAASDPALADIVKIGADGKPLLMDGVKLRKWANGDVVEEATRVKNAIHTGLFTENWTQVRRAEKLLGDTEEATESIQRLSRVLRRSDGEGIMLAGADFPRPRLGPDQLQQLITGNTKAVSLFESLADATTHKEVLAILGPTVEHSGKIPTGLIDELAHAEDLNQVAEVFTRLASGQRILPQRMALLGNAARFGNLSTVFGMSAGGIAGAAQEFEEGGSPAEIIGAGLAGSVLGALGGSALGGIGGGLFGGATRKIEDVADAMDLLLAGSRATVTDFLRSNGVDMGRAQAGLSIPSQLNYAYGHSPLGRRLARTAATNINLNDPTNFYYGLGDYARSLGIDLDEVAEQYVRGSGKAREIETVLVNRLDPEKLAARQAQLEADGYRLLKRVEMDDVLGRASRMQANNPARGHEVLTRFGELADAVLSSKGMSENRIAMLTDMFRQGAQEFMGATNAAAKPAAYAQKMAVGNNVYDLSDGWRLEAELWSGHLDLPDPARVFRAVNQLDAVGRTTQLFTGAGVFRQVRKNMMKLGSDGWERIDISLERNIPLRAARAITSSLWGTSILLGRPFAFASRVLGEDQARMTAAHLWSTFMHPANYVSAIAANFGFFRRHGALAGMVSRSNIPSTLLDESGKVVDDVLNNMNNWSLAENTRHALSIYDRDIARNRKLRVFGSSTWVPIPKDSPGYLEALTTEIRQLVGDPMVRHMARSTAADPVEDTVRWLTGTDDGRRVAEDWARQFHSPQEAAEFMSPDNLRAFLQDEYARLHLKTGGDWVYVMEKGVVLDSVDGAPLSREVLEQNGWLDLEPGYHIVRKGDDELLGIIRSGKIKAPMLDDAGKPLSQTDDAGNVTYLERELKIADHLTEESAEELRNILRRKNDSFKAKIARATDEGGPPPNTMHSFPNHVKGAKAAEGTPELKGIMDSWDDLIDRMYDRWLGKPTRVFSRQPTLGAYYWERVGMLYSSMTDEMQGVYRALATKEKTWGRVKEIAATFDESGLGAKGTLTKLADIDLNAKAYAIERTKDTLFDLHRQRNFIDGLRVILPFAGPFVEAMEAWGRVIARDPLTVWRRGTQAVSHTWNTSGIGDDPDPFQQGWFWTDPETGEEMFTYPFIGRAVPNWLRNISDGSIDLADLGGRARGLNVVFGTEDLTQGTSPEFAGIPLDAFNPGVGPALQVSVGSWMKDKQGAAKEIYEYLFPYGPPDNVFAAMLPYNIRKFVEGSLGKNSQEELTRNTMDQWGRMVATGEVGPGKEFDPDVAGDLDRSMKEARSRAIAANQVEAIARTMLPTLMTLDTRVSIEENPELAGLDVERLATIDALGNLARTLMSTEGAEWWLTPDGYRISTEDNWEATTGLMNELFGLDMFSAEFLSLPLTDRAYPRAYTADGLAWVNNHADLVDEWRSTGTFLMEDYAGEKAKEDMGEYSYEAFDAAMARGDASFYTLDEQREQIESRLLKMANRNVENQALAMFGPDDEMNAEQKDIKNAWVANMKQDLKGRYEAGEIPESEQTKVLNELLSWDREDWNWDTQTLTPGERATVDAMLWYLNARKTGLSIMQSELGVTKPSNVGSGDQEKYEVSAIKEDMNRIVEQQLEVWAQTKTNPGNFPYLWHKYLSEEWGADEEFDALAALAELRRDEMGFGSLDLDSDMSYYTEAGSGS